jgi:hypothetical protein
MTVYVAVRWDAAISAGIKSAHTCFGISVTKTDVNGEFRISSLSWNINRGIERIGYIAAIRALGGCGSERAQKQELPGLFRATLEETEKLARSRAELWELNNAVYDVETLEMGDVKARERYQKRKQEWGIK